MRLTDDTLKAEYRIREAAMQLFPEHGFEATTVRAIAEAADVSPGLVIHHFGSKDALREVCDKHVVDQIRSMKEEAIRENRMTDPSMMAGGFQAAGPLMRYLGWSLSTGSDHAASLFDEMVEEATRLTELGIEAGALEPSPDPRARAAVLLSFQMGSLLLSEHVGRAIGVDVTDLEGVMRVSRASLEIFTGAMFPPGRAEAMTRALEEAIEQTRKEGPDG